MQQCSEFNFLESLATIWQPKIIKWSPDEISYLKKKALSYYVKGK